MSAAHDDLMAVDMEYRLQAAFALSGGQREVAAYLIDRRLVLIPAVLRIAVIRNIDPVDVLAAYVRGLRRRVGAGHSLREGWAA